MKTDNPIVFSPFRLDTREERLYRGDEIIALRPKTFAVLRYLAERPARLVTKEELLESVWAETNVSDTVLKVCIREIREALGDEAKPWRFIETAHRRGYRFVGAVGELSSSQSLTTTAPPRDPARAGPANLVGRSLELGQLDSALQKALGGDRQMVFLTGEAGIGKTSLVDAFLQRAADSSIWIGRGQCLEQYGASEAYMPVLDALSRICQWPGGERLAAVLRQHAPMWLAQMPGLVSPSERERLQQEISGATRERMLREISQALEVATADVPLVLVLEDLHWSDYSTVDLLTSLATQRRPARMMLIGTYRPAEVFSSGHPLKAAKQELQLHGRCIEIPVAFLDETAVAEWLAQRFAAHCPAEVSRWIHRRTDGNPLFMVNVVDYLAGRGLIARVGDLWRFDVAGERDEPLVPENIRQMIEKQIERLGKDQRRILEAASVAGPEFSAAAVAAGLQHDIIVAEEICEDLARRGQFLAAGRPAGLPDGTVTERFRFIHVLYQNALYERIPAGRRAQLHQRIGEYEESAYGERARGMAAELAMHFEQSRDHRRAIRHLQQAAENASRRFAHRDAVALARRGLELVAALSDTPERAQQELLLQATLAVPLGATQGYGAAEVENTYSRARALCQQLGDDLQLFPILVGLSKFYVIRAQLNTARELGEQLLRLAQGQSDPVLLLEAHWALGVSFVNLGEFPEAARHLEKAIGLYRPQDLGTYLKDYGHDPRSVCRSFQAWALWSLGYPDRALQEANAAVAFGRELNHPETLGFALFFCAWVHQLCRDARGTLEHTAALLDLAGEHDLVQWSAFGMSLHGWALANLGEQERGIGEMRQALEIYRAIGSEVSRPHFLGLLAEALADAGRVDEGLDAIAEGLAAAGRTGGRYYEAELHRLQGELILRRGLHRIPVREKGRPDDLVEAERSFRRALDIARRQEAKSFELLAATSLSHLWRRQQRQSEARQMLSEVYGWFTEGHDTPYVRASQKALTSRA